VIVTPAEHHTIETASLWQTVSTGLLQAGPEQSFPIERALERLQQLLSALTRMRRNPLMKPATLAGSFFVGAKKVLGKTVPTSYSKLRLLLPRKPSHFFPKLSVKALLVPLPTGLKLCHCLRGKLAESDCCTNYCLNLKNPSTTLYYLFHAESTKHHYFTTLSH